MVQVNSDKIVTTVSAKGMVLYIIHVVMMNITMSFRRLLNDRGFSLVEFLLVDKHIDGRFDATMNRNHTKQNGIMSLKSSVALTLTSFLLNANFNGFQKSCATNFETIANLLSKRL